jgi:DNA polymerase IV (DinB-like DNA polymerase)
MRRKRILFVDLDYFYAQVEEVINPSLRGKPVAVCVFSGRNEDSGAVATSNYEARKLGIKAGIPIAMAKRLSNDVILLPMRKDLYKGISDKIMGYLSTLGTTEVASIDEAYVDLGEITLEEAFKLAKEVKERIFKDHGLKVSIGVASNKVFAKVACEMGKPDGLVVLDDEKEEKLRSEIEVSEIPGIGPVLREKLNELGVNKLGDMKNLDEYKLRKVIGEAKAQYLISLANGTYDEPVKVRQRKHQGRYVTLKRNTRDPNEIKPYLFRAVDEAFAKASGALPMEIHVVAIMEDIDIVSRSRTFKHPISKDEAYNTCYKLLLDILREDKRQVRRIGATLGKLKKVDGSLDKFFDFKLDGNSV